MTDVAGPMERRVHIRRGDPSEGERLRELTFASKAHWGYDAQRVRDWVDGLDFSPRSPRWQELYVAEVDGRVVAWAALVPQGETCLLDDLWVEPAWLGRGIGKELFRFAAERAREHGARTMEWGAEPYAVGFYEKMGGRQIGDHVSAWGRLTPYMSVDLEPEAHGRG